MTQFLLVGALTAGAILYGTNELADRAASDEAVVEASTTTTVLANTVIGPQVPPWLLRLRPGNLEKNAGRLDNFDGEMQDRLARVKTVDRINIWTRDGRLVYSSALDVLLANLKDLNLRLDEDQRRILTQGGIETSIDDPDDPLRRHSAVDTDTQGKLRIYTRMFVRREFAQARDEPVLFEAYFSLDEIGARRSEIFDSFRWITLGGLVLLVLAATGILVGLTRQLANSSKERERLLRSAMDASDAERRRIARDLHDSVVQDLAGTAFAVSAVSRNPETPQETRETLEGAGTSLRSSLKSLRSLLAEIHPPDLRAEGLPAALADLTAPAGAAGMQASVSVEGAETASDQRAALVWRVAQEAVRNALRHSGASTLAVTVRGDRGRLSLEVVDDGVGFDPAGVRDPDRYGLRGLRSLVADHGGTLDVRSAPGEGTIVHMEVDAQ